VVAHAAFVMGRVITNRFALTKEVTAFSIGLSTLLGYGVYGYVALITSFNAPITPPAVWIPLALILFFGRHAIKDLYLYIVSICKSVRAVTSRVDKILLFSFGVSLVFYGSSAFVPQYRIDSLAYHLPEAVQIAEQGIMSLGGVGNFFGNLPILIETLYAPLYIVSGFTAMNVTHFGMFLAGCIALYGFLKLYFDRTTSLFAVASLFTIYELLVNATSAYVDAATVSFELMGILLFISWLVKHDKAKLILSGLLFGFALSTKYLSLYSLVLLAIGYTGVHLYRKESLKKYFVNGFTFAIPLLLVAGFWYVKNAVVVGNPMYPFMFGHVGFERETLDSLNTAVKQFGDRSVWAFITMPFTHFKNPLYITALLGFLVFPFAYFAKRHIALVRSMMFFTVAYFAVWFFAISHQKRFGLIAIMLLLIVSSITFAPVFKRYKKVIDSKNTLPVFVLVWLLVIVGVYAKRSNYYVQVKATEFLYVLGIDDTQTFYEKRNMGPIYTLSTYINNHVGDSKILNLYSDPDFFLKDATFINPKALINSIEEYTDETIQAYLVDNNIEYITTYSDTVRESYLNDPYFKNNPAEQDYYTDVIQYVRMIEHVVPEIADVVYADHGRVLYKIR